MGRRPFDRDWRRRVPYAYGLGDEFARHGGGVQRHNAHHLVSGVQRARDRRNGALRRRYPGWFRLYALATIAVLVGFGMAASVAIQGIEQNDTPWAGGFERINAYAYFAWLIVLAVTVMRREAPETRSRGERGVTGAKLPT